MRSQALMGLGVFALAILLAWQVGSAISGKDERALIFAAAGLVGFFVVVTIFRNWRSGFYPVSYTHLDVYKRQSPQ